ncbi:MAG: hypothetical protein HOV94_39105, partial [Saccharothrix sp.]|nr:hypothetical protein [Saccharothrix sp.]
MTATRPVPEQVSDPRGVRRRYAGRNMATAGGVVHAADMRASMGELL